jgi:hypothetical protein
MILKDIIATLKEGLIHYPENSSRGGDNYDNGMNAGLKIAIKLINDIDKKPLSLKRKLDYHNRNPKYKDR